jgi:hypothetical protein
MNLDDEESLRFFITLRMTNERCYTILRRHYDKLSKKDTNLSSQTRPGRT